METVKELLHKEEYRRVVKPCFEVLRSIVDSGERGITAKGIMETTYPKEFKRATDSKDEDERKRIIRNLQSRISHKTGPLMSLGLIKKIEPPQSIGQREGRDWYVATDMGIEVFKNPAAFYGQVKRPRKFITATTTLTPMSEQKIQDHTEQLKTELIIPWINALKRVKVTWLGIYYSTSEPSSWVASLAEDGDLNNDMTKVIQLLVWLGFEGPHRNAVSFNHFNQYHDTHPIRLLTDGKIQTINTCKLLDILRDVIVHFEKLVRKLIDRISEIMVEDFQKLLPEILATYKLYKEIKCGKDTRKDRFIDSMKTNIQYLYCEYVTRKKMSEKLQCGEWSFYNSQYRGYWFPFTDSILNKRRRVIFTESIDIQELEIKMKSILIKLSTDRTCQELGDEINEARGAIQKILLRMEENLRIYEARNIFSEKCSWIQ